MGANLRMKKQSKPPNNNNNNVVSYHTNIQTKDSQLADIRQTIPTRTSKEILLRARNLSLIREGKIKGAFQRVINEALEIGLDSLENKQQHTTSYAISGKTRYRSDVVDKLEQIKHKLKEYEYKSENFPVFHMNTVIDMIAEVIPPDADTRTLKKYRKIVLSLCKEAVRKDGTVLTSRFDVSLFLKHQFLRDLA